MEIRKATGIVLHSLRMGEADAGARVFTREYGKLNFIFKGLKKSRKRPQSAADPGTTIELLYYHHDGREYQVVNEVRVSSHREPLRGDLGRVLHLYYLLDCIDRTSAAGDPAPRLFDLLAAALDALAASSFKESLSVFFTLHLMRMLGILADYTTCSQCGGRDFSRFIIDTIHFRPVCADCSGTHSGSKSFSTSMRDYIERALRLKFGDVPHERYDPGELMDFLFYLALSLESYFHVKIRSKEMLFSQRPGS